jgi:lysophospholipase L1-like esterase
MLRLVQTIWSIAGLTIIAILLTEGGFRLLFAIKDRLATQQVPDQRVIEAGYRGETWPIRHYRELESLEDRWQPYVYFRQKPYSGQTITIDQEGLRATWQPPPALADRDGSRPSRILMLGGSSLWGFGARDDRTIPSLIARKLSEKGLRIEVRNLAEIGYVSTQEVIALVRELQAGYRPDLVIFYDGVNDSTSALLEGEASVTTNERNRRVEFNLRQSPARLGGAMIAGLIRASASYRLAQTIAHRLLGTRGAEGSVPPADRRKELAAEVERRYRANLAIVNRLARGFGFETLYYWQPLVFDKPSPTPYEREEAQKLGWARNFLGEVYDAIRTSTELSSERHFHDLSRIFTDSQGLIFIDYCHTTESANDRIAEAMARDAQEVLRAARHGGESGSGAVR